MHIGIAGPINTRSLKAWIDTNIHNWPVGDGGGTPVNHQINALLELGHKISVFTLSTELEGKESFEWHQNNLSIYMGPFRKRARHRCIDFFKKERSFLTRSMQKAQPEIIHAHWQYEYGWAALDAGLPALLTCHDAPARILKATPDLYRFIRFLMAVNVLHKADYLTAVSPYTAKGLRHFTKKNIDIIPNFEPDEVFSYYSQRKLDDKKLKIAMINNGFYGLKNVAKGIEAFHEYRKENTRAELHLFGIGHGVNEDAFLWCSDKGMFDGIYFHGALSFDKLMSELSGMNILLHTSKEESCPMVLIEAMAMGIPVIGGRESGGVPWVLYEGGGVLVDITSAEGIVEGLRRAGIPKQYEQFSEDARYIALERFDKRVVMNKYLQAYKKVLQNEGVAHIG